MTAKSRGHEGEKESRERSAHMNTGTAGPRPRERTVKLTMAVARKDTVEGESLVPLSDVVVSLDADIALVHKSRLADTIVVILELSININ